MSRKTEHPEKLTYTEILSRAGYTCGTANQWLVSSISNFSEKLYSNILMCISSGSFWPLHQNLSLIARSIVSGAL